MLFPCFCSQKLPSTCRLCIFLALASFLPGRVPHQVLHPQKSICLLPWSLCCPLLLCCTCLYFLQFDNVFSVHFNCFQISGNDIVLGEFLVTFCFLGRFSVTSLQACFAGVSSGSRCRCTNHFNLLCCIVIVHFFLGLQVDFCLLEHLVLFFFYIHSFAIMLVVIQDM